MSQVRIITGRQQTYVNVESTSLQAVIGQRAKRKLGEYDNELWVNMGAGGLGDSLLGLCAVKGLRNREPNTTIIYKVSEPRIPFVAMFDGGYDGLADHDWDETWNDFPLTCDPRDLQLNMGYKREVQQAAEITRLQRYCRNLGWVQPELPTIRDEQGMKEVGKEFSGYVALCPFTDLQSREWPMFYWLTLEKMLNKEGIPTVLCGSLRKKDPIDHSQFKSINAVSTEEQEIPPMTTASILYNASCVVANDSGLAHLAGIMGKPTLIMCGWSVGERIYGFYPKAVSLQGKLPCSGCWTCVSKSYNPVRCAVVCDNLATILPGEVFQHVTTAIQAKTVE